jgi:hypothetical protein
MKRKQEDRLMRLAFGDLSIEESAALEKQVAADPESADVLAEFRGLREDLRALADVPAHQLSNERLREAILGQGLKPKAPEPMLSWLWMPATAVCVIAAFFVLGQRRGSVEPRLVGFPNSVPVAGETAFDLGPMKDPASISKPAAPKSVMIHGPSPIRLAVAEEPRPARHRRSSHAAFGVDPGWVALSDSSDSSSADMPGGSVPGASDGTSAPAGADPTANLKPIDDKSTPTVVVINPDTDQDTGASTATEVGSGKNVVVGG